MPEVLQKSQGIEYECSLHGCSARFRVDPISGWPYFEMEEGQRLRFCSSGHQNEYKRRKKAGRGTVEALPLPEGGE